MDPVIIAVYYIDFEYSLYIFKYQICLYSFIVLF